MDWFQFELAFSLMDKAGEHFFNIFVGDLYFFLWELPIRFIIPFIDWQMGGRILIFAVLKIYILDIRPLSEEQLTKIFPHLEAVSLLYWVSFAVHNLFNLMKFIVLLLVQSVPFSKYLPIPVLWGLFLKLSSTSFSISGLKYWSLVHFKMMRQASRSIFMLLQVDIQLWYYNLLNTTTLSVCFDTLTNICVRLEASYLLASPPKLESVMQAVRELPSAILLSHGPCIPYYWWARQDLPGRACLYAIVGSLLLG